jgi:pimeloyl-ACP methyl ester carboxylesterase
MKTLAITFKILRWIAATFLILFSIATFIGKSYGQTIILAAIAITLVFWPISLKKRLSTSQNIILRILVIAILIMFKQTVFKSEPKSSIYISEEKHSKLMEEYDRCMKPWPEDTKSIFLNTRYGKVHILECGNPENPPLVMFHAASMGAHSWAENLEPIIDKYHIYSFDNPGEGNKSSLSNALIFPETQEEIADLYAEMLDMLGIDSAVVFGASNGGFIAQSLAAYHPEKVYKMALFGPMGLTQITTGSIAMMTLATMYPFQWIRDIVANWALGRDPKSHQAYGAWFNASMSGTIPSIAAPVPMTTAQKQAMDLPVLLYLGTNDKIVGDAGIARDMAEAYPNIRIETLDSGHLIAVEESEIVNQGISDFLGLESLD